MILRDAELRITEIFHSLQGESITIGLPTVFVRLTGCPLRCHYCDTAYAFKGGIKLTLSNILTSIEQYQCQYITVTGGEPLAQPNCIPLLTQLCDQGYHVSIETSGALPIDNIDKRVMIVMDLKTPDSGEEGKNLFANIGQLKTTDQIKFVLCSRDDYDWAKALVSDHALDKQCQLLFSPSFEQLSPRQLADWIVADNLPVRFQVQLHKILWNDEPSR